MTTEAAAQRGIAAATGTSTDAGSSRPDDDLSPEEITGRVTVRVFSRRNAAASDQRLLGAC
ncbi:hypothetical protein [Arthrobacter sp. UYEF36]|uniref:hypothetical protein n=1 Tax=Arthrobacter sp. UYEF36 TaxID=1756366 RepID=UPI0033964B90